MGRAETDKVNLSLIIPVNDEEEIIKGNTIKVVNFLRKSKVIGKFEVLLCDNGSTDSTLKIAKDLQKQYKEVRALHDDRRGLGIAILLGIKNARYEYLKKQDIDLPFGVEIIEKCIKEIGDADAVIDSKGHKDSMVKRPFTRRVYSKILNMMLFVLYGINVKDTQGSILFRKSQYMKFIKRLDSPTAFMQTQLVIYAKMNGLTIKEIPVKYIEEGRSTKMKPLLDGIHIFFEIIKERFKIWFS